MVMVEVNAGACGMVSTIEAQPGGEGARLTVASDCPAVQDMAEELGEISMTEVLSGPGQGRVFDLAREHLTHAACPVAAGMIKAAEVAMGLNLPKDATITFK